MKQRKLKSSTIVPPDLYVERAADRQLRAIVDEMGRPGYVLVARQMGKTNLLLNMKREREREGDIVAYFDLSNRLDTPRLWFRNIIDIIVEANFDRIPRASQEILRQRESLNLEPNFEYDRHLRLILREVQTKVIIVLDEIDSLVNTRYSDVIFSQIRSMYFSRANYPEYNNLTYVLSGVIEPTKLIKDKNISPFNIGEKIYLESFSRGELESFLSVAGLGFSSPTVSRIYDWTAGNPRMTWDICSELELLQQSGRDIRPEEVDQVVGLIYLERFDRAPVDHIRILTKSDSKIRGGIVSIRYGKSEFIDQDLRNRLYLAGVTNSAGTDVRIANKIIDLALSEAWLADSSNMESSVNSGMRVFEQGNYRQAIASFEEARASNDESFTAEEHLALAESYLYLGNYNAATNEFNACLSSRKELSVRQAAYLGLGVALLHEGKTGDAKEALLRGEDGPDVRTAEKAFLENSNLIGESDVAHLNMALTRCASISQLDWKISGNEAIRENVVFAIYVAHTLLMKLRRKEEALRKIEAALEICNEQERPTILVDYAEIGESRREKIIRLREAVEILTTSYTGQPLGADFGVQLGARRLAKLMLLLLREKLYTEFGKLSYTFSKNWLAEEVSPFIAIKHLYSEVAGINNKNSGFEPLIIYALKNFETGNVAPDEVIEVLREIVSVTKGFERNIFIHQYLAELKRNKDVGQRFFNEVHAHELSMIAIACQRDEDWRLARDLFEVWEDYRKVTIVPTASYAILDLINMRAVLANRLRSPVSNVELASRLILFVKANEEALVENNSDEVITYFLKEAEDVLKTHQQVKKHEDPFNNFARKDRVVVEYKNGLQTAKKFKYLEADLRSGKCIVITHFPVKPQKPQK